MNWKNAFYGMLVGLLISFPMMGIMYLAQQIIGTPFPPYDIFTWVSRVLPGSVITIGIDLLIDFLRFFGLSVASTAKTVELLMALGLFAAYGMIGGAIYFYLVSLSRIKNNLVTVLFAALGLGTPVAAISLLKGENILSPIAHFLWLAGIFLAWGLAFQSVYQQAIVTQSSKIGSITGEQAIVQRISRRKFLLYLGGTSAAITVIGAGLGRVLENDLEESIEKLGNEMTERSQMIAFPNADDPVIPVSGTRPEYTPLEDHFSVFIGLETPAIDEDSWQLPITGMVNNPLMLTLKDLRERYEVWHQFVTLRCISGRIGTNLIGTTLWTGARLKDILADADIQEGGRYLILTSADGYYETINLELINKDPRIMLTYEWDGRPLPEKHGFPLRVWIPDVYGMKQPKWISGMEVVGNYKDGYWVERGWDIFARVNTTSVIDTVASDSIIEKDGQQLIPIGGIAYSGARGISKVEVQVDEGDWEEAQLRKPLSDTTWVIWRFDWPYQKGDHTFSVRCYEADGTPQILEKSRLRPGGATGMHSVEKRIYPP